MSEPTSGVSLSGVDVPGSSAELLPELYAELRRLAARRLARERPGQTLQATALVHEAWLRLENKGAHPWSDQSRFFAAAAEAMRRILIDRARRKISRRHGGQWQRVELDAVEIVAPLPDEQLLELDEALNELAGVDPVAAQLVKLRFFAGLTQAQAADQLDLSRSAADRTWQFARAWLFSRIRPPDPPTSDARKAAAQLSANFLKQTKPIRRLNK